VLRSSAHSLQLLPLRSGGSCVLQRTAVRFPRLCYTIVSLPLISQQYFAWHSLPLNVRACDAAGCVQALLAQTCAYSFAMHAERLSLCRYHSRWSFTLPAPGRTAFAAASGRSSRQRPSRLALLATVLYSGAARLRFFLAAGAFPNASKF
jgi:hypothetical protein